MSVRRTVTRRWPGRTAAARTGKANGETVVALLDNGEATLKRFYRERGRIRLQPANAAYEPMFVDSVTIQGLVIGVIRLLR